VNAILDAAYASAKSKQWEPVRIEDWRGVSEVSAEKEMTSYNEEYYLVKEEILPTGEKKFIIKHKKTGSIERR
jgi:hypothetical protein